HCVGCKPETVNAHLRDNNKLTGRHVMVAAVQTDAGVTAAKIKHLQQAVMLMQLYLPIVQFASVCDKLAVHHIGCGPLLPLSVELVYRHRRCSCHKTAIFSKSTIIIGRN